MDIEKLLDALFDFQRFERNEALQSVIDEAETQRLISLTDAELESLSAAGDPFSQLTGLNQKDGFR
ncbi:MAG: hypothetical protein II881_04085 [Oscillospiraceae bacterium]|nr:hypothetical protein [Oscillospiraceae bacterium]